MALPPHLHLLIPSSSPSISLEARLYLPLQLDDTSGDAGLPLSRAEGSKPIRLDTLIPPMRDAIRAMGVERLITAAHPWAKLGGNMLDPVISQHLLSAVLELPADAPGKGKTAVLSFNVRGTGKSEGSAPLFTVGREPDDFSAMEKAGLELCGTGEAWRFGYSWGCTAALAAPPPTSGVKGVFLVSPAFAGTKILGLMIKTVATALKDYLSPSAGDGTKDGTEGGKRVYMAFGTDDNFTGIATYRSTVKQYSDKGLKGVEVERADHFWRSEPEALKLESAIQEWLSP